jgi:hypothetical protein
MLFAPFLLAPLDQGVDLLPWLRGAVEMPLEQDLVGQLLRNVQPKLKPVYAYWSDDKEKRKKWSR